MFHEYRLQEGKSGLMLRHAAYSGITFLVSALIAFLWMYFFEPVALRLTYFPFVAMTGTLVAAGIVSAIQTVMQVKNFRMISTDEGLSYRRGIQEVKLLYSDITRIDILPLRELLIYTTVSDTTPAMIISNHLTDRDVLDSILNRYSNYTPVQRIPLIYTMWYRQLLTGLFLTSIVLNLATRDPYMRLLSGITLLVTIIISLWFRVKFRKQMSFDSTLIIYLFLLAIVAVRTAITFYPLYNR